MGNCLESAYKSPFSTLLLPSDLLANRNIIQIPWKHSLKEKWESLPLNIIPKSYWGRISGFPALEVRGTDFRVWLRLWPRVALLTFCVFLSPEFPFCMKGALWVDFKEPQWLLPGFASHLTGSIPVMRMASWHLLLLVQHLKRVR